MEAKDGDDLLRDFHHLKQDQRICFLGGLIQWLVYKVSTLPKLASFVFFYTFFKKSVYVLLGDGNTRKNNHILTLMPDRLFMLLKNKKLLFLVFISRHHETLMTKATGLISSAPAVCFFSSKPVDGNASNQHFRFNILKVWCQFSWQ